MYKEIPGYAGNYITPTGACYSTRQGSEWKARKHSVTRRGYHQIIVGGPDGKQVGLRVQRMVMVTFCQRPVRHLDGNSNSKLALRYNVSRPTIQAARSGATWKHIPLATGRKYAKPKSRREAV